MDRVGQGMPMQGYAWRCMSTYSQECIHTNAYRCMSEHDYACAYVGMRVHTYVRDNRIEKQRIDGLHVRIGEVMSAHSVPILIHADMRNNEGKALVKASP